MREKHPIFNIKTIFYIVNQQVKYYIHLQNTSNSRPNLIILTKKALFTP
nr:MAG TPA: hypothetical protein [Caudoviricetes sp.]